MPLSSRVVQKAVDLSMVKGKALGSILNKVAQTASSKNQGFKDKILVKRTLSQSSALAESSFKQAFKALDRADAIKGKYSGTQGANLLKAAAIEVKKNEAEQAKEQKQKNLKRALSARVREEFEKGGRGGHLTKRDVVEAITKERDKSDEVFNVLEQAKDGGESQTQSANAVKNQSSMPTAPAKQLVDMPIDWE